MTLTNYYTDELLEIRFKLRKEKNYKTSDMIRDYLDDKLIFIFDFKDDYETYYLAESYFKNMEKIESLRGIKFKNKREFVEFRLNQDRKAEKHFEAWLFTQNQKILNIK